MKVRQTATSNAAGPDPKRRRKILVSSALDRPERVGRLAALDILPTADTWERAVLAPGRYVFGIGANCLAGLSEPSQESETRALLQERFVTPL